MLADGRPHLEEMDVHPAHWRLWLGTALVRAVLRWVVHSGYETLTHTTFRDVLQNLPFYARPGLVELLQPELSPELLAVIEGEARRGLDPKIRAAMVWSQRDG
jgi:GNAT superfamily N-acetyltransferase